MPDHLTDLALDALESLLDGPKSYPTLVRELKGALPAYWVENALGELFWADLAVDDEYRREDDGLRKDAQVKVWRVKDRDAALKALRRQGRDAWLKADVVPRLRPSPLA